MASFKCMKLGILNLTNPKGTYFRILILLGIRPIRFLSSEENRTQLGSTFLLPFLKEISLFLENATQHVNHAKIKFNCELRQQHNVYIRP